MTHDEMFLMAVAFILVGYTLVLMYQNNKLVNKIMSRDFHGYQMSQKVGTLDQPKPPKTEDGLAEDLASIF